MFHQPDIMHVRMQSPLSEIERRVLHDVSVWNPEIHSGYEILDSKTCVGA